MVIAIVPPPTFAPQHMPTSHQVSMHARCSYLLEVTMLHVFIACCDGCYSSHDATLYSSIITSRCIHSLTPRLFNTGAKGEGKGSLGTRLVYIRIHLGKLHASGFRQTLSYSYSMHVCAQSQVSSCFSW